jgi:hypothetical protein
MTGKGRVGVQGVSEAGGMVALNSITEASRSARRHA